MTGNTDQNAAAGFDFMKFFDDTVGGGGDTSEPEIAPDVEGAPIVPESVQEPAAGIVEVTAVPAPVREADSGLDDESAAPMPVTIPGAQIPSSTIPPKQLAAVATWEAMGPLVIAAFTGSGNNEEERRGLFNFLVDRTLAVGAAVAAEIGGGVDLTSDGLRWRLLNGAAGLVASYFQEKGAVPPSNWERSLATSVQSAMKLVPSGLGTVDRGPMVLEGMIPVIGAVARFSFGRDEGELVAEIGKKLQELSRDAARKMGGEGRRLELAVFRVLGKLYASCHHDEIDRLQDLEPTERAEYARKHGARVPMDPIWEKTDRLVALLIRMAQAVELPSEAMVEVSPAL